MCIVELQVSVQACRHRWYRLRQSCHDGLDLARCPSKVQLVGWEGRTDLCPFCNSAAAEAGRQHYRLLGSDLSPPSLVMTRRSSRHNSLSAPPPTSTERCYSSNGAAPEPPTNLTVAASNKNRAMNLRLDTYLACSPEYVVPIDKPAPPSGPAVSALVSVAADGDDKADDAAAAGGRSGGPGDGDSPQPITPASTASSFMSVPARATATAQDGPVSAMAPVPSRSRKKGTLFRLSLFK